ncbi:rod-determining factor RdfA [Salinirubrum litoreum]|uniref:Rod-determining factor RdfA n=1 Tax=Salinirubrum litoreum TaxID=1126234 RepID=A0ABD5RGN0_9EURY|nr:rod-determining factor RdfA [Salinirubrum litoreum]
MTDPTETDESRTVGETKVERLLAKYELDGLGAELEARWTGPPGERESLRTLATAFNRRLLEAAMRDAQLNPLAGEVENLYRQLTSDEVSRGVQTEVETRLAHRGVDVETLDSEFVTYQAIRSYLKDVRGATYETSPSDTYEQGQRQLERLIGRTTAVVEQKLEQFVGAGRLTLGSFHVQTAVTVYCEDCERQYDLSAVLAAGGCDCTGGE